MDLQSIKEFIVQRLDGTDYFLVDVSVSPDNRIVVEIDRNEGVDIDFCVELTRAFEEEFDRDREDYELEIGSAGLTSPFKVKGQYIKNIGNEVEVLTAEGPKVKGILTEADDESFTVSVPTKVKVEGKKKPVMEDVPRRFAYGSPRSVTLVLKF